MNWRMPIWSRRKPAPAMTDHEMWRAGAVRLPVALPIASGKERVAEADNATLQFAAGGLVVVAGAYNAVLAVINAHVATLGHGIAVLSEGMLLGAAGLIVMLSGLRKLDALPIVFIWLSAMLAVLISLSHDRLYPDGFRNMLIAGMFLALGHRASIRTLRIAVVTLTAMVFVVLTLEVTSLTTYVTLFSPAAFLQATRGVEISEFNESGLFNTSLSYADRFSFGLTQVRASSIFLESVSLGNYGSVVSLFVACFWRHLSVVTRAFLILTVVFILVATNGRAATLMTLLFLGGYFVFPLLPRFANLLIPAGVIALATLVFNVSDGKSSDTFTGRINHAVISMLDMDLPTLMVGDVGFRNLDSGYGFLISSATLWGALAYIVLVLVALPQRSRDGRRAAIVVGCYILLNLVIAGTSIFSMKTAALVWFIIGVLRASDMAGSDTAKNAFGMRSKTGSSVGPPTSDIA